MTKEQVLLTVAGALIVLGMFVICHGAPAARGGANTRAIAWTRCWTSAPSRRCRSP
jgi:hypothetical protein